MQPDNILSKYMKFSIYVNYVVGSLGILGLFLLANDGELDVYALMGGVYFLINLRFAYLVQKELKKAEKE